MRRFILILLFLCALASMGASEGCDGGNDAACSEVGPAKFDTAKFDCATLQ